MAYPTTGNPVTELLIDGTWTDISDRVRAPDGQPAIRISRGRSNEQARVAAQRADLELHNSDGVLSNRNPNSAYYGLLPRNTQCRIMAGTGDTYMRLPHDYSEVLTARASTPDVAALDLVGDIEVRVDVQPHTWRPRQFQVITGKYKITGDQRSWLLYMTAEGKLTFTWSTAGTNASRLTKTSTVAVPATAGRLSIKVTLDVNNGAAGNDVAFYTASSIDGTYTQLGTTVTTAGVTSVFSSSANLTIGQGDDNGGVFTDGDPLQGKVYKLQVRSSIGGTQVANPDFTTQTFGATSFADATGKTWTVGAGARVTSDRCRMWGELSSMPQRWDPTGVDVSVRATVSGVLRRLTQGASPIRSALYRALSQRSLTGYWPLEDGSTAEKASSAVTGAKDATLTNVTLGSSSDLPGASTVAVFGEATSKFTATTGTSSVTGTAYFTIYFKPAALPAAEATFVTLYTSGTAQKINIKIGPTGMGFVFIDDEGVTLDTSSVAIGTDTLAPDVWMACNLLLETSGGNVSWSARFSNILAESFGGIGPDTFAGTVGRITNVHISTAASANLQDIEVAHVHAAVVDQDFVSDDLATAANAFFGEAAGVRMTRLASDMGVTVEITGDPADTETMGYQTVSTLVDLFYECADADMGIMSEGRDFLGMQYTTRSALEHRLDLELSYTSKHLSEVPNPTEDDQGVINDVTVSRTNAGSGRREIESGPMSVLDPPDGIGRYDTAVTLNIELDSRLVDLASWMANRGSVDEARYPNLAVGLHRSVITASTTLTAQIMAMDVGMTAAMTDLPAWLPPDDVLLLVQGYYEELGKFLWTVRFNTTPASPYNTGRYDYTTEAGTSRYDHATSTLNAGVTSSATTVVVAANSSTPVTADVWTSDSAQYPFDVMVDGERMTLTQAPGGATSPQTFNNVTRSVNGVVKAHSAGARFRLARPVYWGL